MRITGGNFRSRVLKAPRGVATRPTSDRVREALFSMLAADGVFDPSRDDLDVLDLYAGSGALAFEALSRGARSAVLVEHAREAAAAIRDNARALGVEGRIKVVSARVDRALDKPQADFGLIFADPPYADVRTPAFAGVLAQIARRLAPTGVFVLEHASVDASPDIPGLSLDRSRKHGDTTLSLYRRADDARSLFV